MRVCGHCGERKPPSEFGVAPYCRQCVREYHRARRAAQRADLQGIREPEALPGVTPPVTGRPQALRP